MSWSNRFAIDADPKEIAPMTVQPSVSPTQLAAGRHRALGLSTLAFTVCFSVWTIFAIIGIQIQTELGLNETEFGLLIGTPILTGSLVRLALGIWTDQYGGRVVFAGVMFTAAIATVLLTFAYDYPTYLLAALGHRRCRRFVCQRRRLCLALVSQGAAGHGARHLRHGQCRRGGDQVPRADA